MLSKKIVPRSFGLHCKMLKYGVVSTIILDNKAGFYGFQLVPCGTPIQDSIDDQLKAVIYCVKGFTEV